MDWIVFEAKNENMRLGAQTTIWRLETMSQISKIKVGFDKEIEAVDKAIVAHEKEIEELICKRYELIARKNDFDMQEVVEYLIESNVKPKEIMELIIAAIDRKHKRPE